MSTVVIGEQLSIAGRYVISAANADQLQGFCAQNNAHLSVLPNRKLKLEYEHPAFVANLSKFLKEYAAELKIPQFDPQILATKNIINQLKMALSKGSQIFARKEPPESTPVIVVNTKDQPKFFIYDFFLQLAKKFYLAALKPLQEWIFGAVDYADDYESWDVQPNVPNLEVNAPKLDQKSTTLTFNYAYNVPYNISSDYQTTMTPPKHRAFNSPRLRSN